MERRLFFYTILIVLLFSPFTNIYSQSDSSQIEDFNDEGKRLARIGDFDGALDNFQSMLDLDSNSYKALNNMGMVYKRLGRYNDVLDVVQDAEDIIIRQFGTNDPKLLQVYVNFGNIYNLKQDYELALQYFNYAERIVQLNESTIHDNELTSNTATSIYNNIGNVYYFMGEWRRALNSYKKGIEVKERYNSPRIDISYANCAGAYEEMGIIDSAKLYYEKSIETKVIEFGEESYYLINVYNNYSSVLQDLDEDEEALYYLNKALEIAEKRYPEKHPIVSDCYRYLADYYLATGNSEQALKEFHKSLVAIVFDFDEVDPYLNPSLESEIISESFMLQALRGKAEAFETLYNEKNDLSFLIASLETLEVSNLLTEKMRSSYLGQESKLFIAQSTHEGLSRAIHTAYELYQLTSEAEYMHRAFNYAEKSKSSVLLSSLQEVENKQILGIPQDIQDNEADLKSERDVYKKKIYEEIQREQPDSARLGIWQGKLIEISQELDSINTLIKEKYPEYAATYDNEVVGIQTVKEHLSSRQALIEYSFTDSTMFIFLISSEDEYFIREPITSSFHKNMNVLGAFLRNNDFANNTFADFQQYTGAAYNLYEVLIQPLEQYIEGKDLIIIPDGELGYIPFEALLTSREGSDRMDYRSLPYLIYTYGTNYSYSATLHFDNARTERKAPKQMLAFAPDYNHVKTISSDKFPTFRNYQDVLVPLRFAAEEIQNISDIMESDSYDGQLATEQTFRQYAPDYDILHLAMHTLINDENPMYSQLVFSLNNDTIEDNDGLLNTYELFNIQLSARMAVLSACNTGYGQLREGEGVMSLARGFISAGVPSIIMTLWAVEDQSGSVLMSKFYENLEKGSDIDVALRESKLSYLKTADQLGAHPYLWSGYVSIGSTDPLTSAGLPLTYTILIVLAALVLAIGLLLLRKRKKRA